MSWIVENYEFIKQAGLLGALLGALAVIAWLFKKLETRFNEMRTSDAASTAAVREADAERIKDAHKMIPVIQGNSDSLEAISAAMETRNRLTETLAQSFAENAKRIDSLERTITIEIDRFRDQLNRIEASIRNLEGR